MKLYAGLEWCLHRLDPLLRKIGYERLDRPFVAVERVTKGFLLDSQSCGQCIVGFTGLSCPMNCPKKMRNGPCGGVRADGKCEIEPDVDCVWVLAWQGNRNLHDAEYPIQRVQPPLDHRRQGRSAWLHELEKKSQPASGGD